MKTIYTRKILVLVMMILIVHESKAESSSAPYPDVPELGSYCDLGNAQSKTLDLLFATAAGPQPAAGNSLFGALQTLSLLLESELMECWSAEGAYYTSIIANNGTPGQAETAQYSAAQAQLQQTLTEIPTTLPGEAPADAKFNTEIGNFYNSQIGSLNEYLYLPSVRAINDRLYEALEALNQTSMPCRMVAHLQGGASCPILDEQIQDLTTAAEVAVAGLVPQINALTNTLNASQADFNSTMALMQRDQAAISNLQGQLTSLFSNLNQYVYWANYNAYYVYYYVAVAQQYAAWGYWNYFAYFWNIALAYEANFQVLITYYIPVTQTVIQQAQGQLAPLLAAIPQLQQQSINEITAINSTKAKIRDFPVASLLIPPLSRQE